MKMNVMLIRHGKTKGNLEGRYIGKRTDESLCEEGKVELLALKDSLENMLHPNIIYSSPMKRAIETVEVLFENNDKNTYAIPFSSLEGTKSFKRNPIIINNLTEIDFGDFENKNYKELNGNKDYQRFIDSGGKTDYPNGEKTADFIRRSLDGFYQIISDMKERDIMNAAVVCHGGNIMAIMSELTGEDYFDFQVKNGSGFVLSLEISDGDIIKNYGEIDSNNTEINQSNCREINGKDINLLSYSRI